MRRGYSLYSLVAVGLSMLACTVPALAAGSVAPAQLEALRFRFVGPQHGNRASVVTGVPGNPNVYYVGAASGGVWKSTDGGFHFAPIFDKQPVQSIGAIAVDPEQHDTVWVGTGESWVIRNGITPGDGVYRSNDGGRTWRHMGLEDTGLISRIAINPRDSKQVYVCALGTGTKDESARGVWRTEDGGKTWKHVLFVNGGTGCSGMAIDASDPDTLFAGFWQFKLRPWQMIGGGASSGVYVTHDGGDTWHRITGHGMPHGPLGRVDVAIARSNPQRVYALIETARQGSLWRSDDGGRDWHVENYSRLLTERAGYSTRVAVSPIDEDKVYVASNEFYVSGNGGKTFRRMPWGGDNHDIWIDPGNAQRMMISADWGPYISTTGGRNWHHEWLPIGQTYHVAVDNRVPYWVYANMQDDDAGRGPAYPRSTPQIDPGEWQEPMGGCESGFTYPDPTDSHIVWSTCYGNEVTRLDTRVGYPRAVSPWPSHSLSAPPQSVKYRCHWTPPLAIDPFDHNSVYYGCQVIFRTTNGGQTWKVISPDLSVHGAKYLVGSGGIPIKGKMYRQDNLGQFYGEVVYAIAPSPVKQGEIWAGTNDGQVWLTRDGGGHWSNVTGHIPDLKPWGTINRIEPSFFDAGTAYVAVDRALMGDSSPYIYKTTDYGRHWRLVVHGIPVSPTSTVSSVAQDPNDRDLLFAGTGSALYVSFDAGGRWVPFQAGLPHVPVSWETVQKPFHDLVVSTYGRGVYVLEDITPLEQMTGKVQDAPVHVFQSRPTYRFFHGAHAFVDFWLRDLPKDAKSVKVSILDAQGHLVRHLDLNPGLDPVPAGGGWMPGHAVKLSVGINRVYWDLRYAPPKLVKLRSTPSSNPQVWNALRFMGKDERAVGQWGVQPAEAGPTVAPGTYTAQVSVDGKTYEAPLRVLPDPRSPETPEQTRARVKLLLHVRDDITDVSTMVNRTEWLRKQLQTLRAMLESEGKARNKAMLGNIAQMQRTIGDLEDQLLSPHLANSDVKTYLGRDRLYMHLIWLNAEMGTGALDVYGDPGYPPTDASLQVLHKLDAQLDQARAQYRTLMETTLPKFNRSLIDHRHVPVVAPGATSQGT